MNKKVWTNNFAITRQRKCAIAVRENAQAVFVIIMDYPGGQFGSSRSIPGSSWLLTPVIRRDEKLIDPPPALRHLLYLAGIEYTHVNVIYHIIANGFVSFLSKYVNLFSLRQSVTNLMNPETLFNLQYYLYSSIFIQKQCPKYHFKKKEI